MSWANSLGGSMVERQMKPRVLVVDDDGDILETIQEHLVNCGYKVAITTSASMALSMLKESDFDVVVTDLVMPGINGIEFSRMVHADYPVVMMSGHPLDEIGVPNNDVHDAFIDKLRANHDLSRAIDKAIF